MVKAIAEQNGVPVLVIVWLICFSTPVDTGRRGINGQRPAPDRAGF